MTITIPEDVKKKVIHDMMENYPEAGNYCCLECIEFNYDKVEFEFFDHEEDKTHKVTMVELLKAFDLMFTDKWPKGCTQPIAKADVESWEDWLCQADANDNDAFVQLAIFGEVIYG